MERQSSARLNAQIYEEACAWFIECRSGDLDDAARANFDRWLRKSPEHLTAYLEITAIWNEGPYLDPQNRWNPDRLILEAAVNPDNVVALPAPMSADGAAPQAPGTHEPSTAAGEASRMPPVRTSRRRWVRRRVALAASLAAAVSVAAGTVWFWVSGRGTYSTATGEERSLVLSDGSVVELDAQSMIRVRYTSAERDVYLLSGQALFHVAKDVAHPFIVHSGDTLVRAVGTRFDVYKRDGGTLITVVEGRVAVLTGERLPANGTSPLPPATLKSLPPNLWPISRGEPQSGLLLVAGEQLAVSPQAIGKVEHANIADATAWTQRQLVFESATLEEVATEFNRYNERKLIIEGHPADFHISGVFSSTDPSSLIRFLSQRPGLRVIQSATEIRIERNSR
jgi:transmembrane sensor